MRTPARFWGFGPLRALTDPLVQALPLPNVNPTIVTFLALPLSVAFSFLWAAHPVAAAACLVGVLLSDGLDGAIARKYGRSSDRGWWIDSLTDRLSEFILFWTFPVWRLLAVLNLVLLFVGYRIGRNLTVVLRVCFGFWLFVVFVVLPRDLDFQPVVGLGILRALWFFLPIGIANVVPFLVRHHLHRIAVPLDARRTFRGKRILGDHKTLRGLLAGVIAGGLVGMIQRELFLNFDGIRSISIVDYATIGVSLGAVMGFGALFGDVVESFVKRQRGHAPGAYWFPWDKIDFVIGGLVFALLFVWPGWGMFLGVLLLGSFLSVIMDHVAYFLGMRKTPW